MLTGSVSPLELRPVSCSSTARDSFPHRVYTGEQIWEKVLDAGLEDELSAIRLGDSFELGTFLGYDLLKGIVATGCVFASENLIFL